MVKSLSSILQHAGSEFRVGSGLVSATETSVTFCTQNIDDIPVYGRMSNTQNHAEIHKLFADLYQTEQSLVFGSGMAALSAVFLTFLKPGDHAVILENCYGTSQSFFKKLAKHLGIDSTFAKVEDWKKVTTSKTKLFHFESISNPFCVPQDFEVASAAAKAAGAPLVCDNTFASPLLCEPLKYGVDLVVESATKYLNGHSDVIAGVVAGKTKYLQEIYETSKILGGYLPAKECVQLMRGLRTLEVRMNVHKKNGAAFAQRMREKSYVAEVCYGTSTNAKKFFPEGFGGMCTVRFKPEVDVVKLLSKTKLIKNVPSLGGTESTATMPYFTTHYMMNDTEKKALGVDKQLVRFSVGLENVDELIADLDQLIK